MSPEKKQNPGTEQAHYVPGGLEITVSEGAKAVGMNPAEQQAVFERITEDLDPLIEKGLRLKLVVQTAAEAAAEEAAAADQSGKRK